MCENLVLVVVLVSESRALQLRSPKSKKNKIKAKDDIKPQKTLIMRKLGADKIVDSIKNRNWVKSFSIFFPLILRLISVVADDSEKFKRC